MLELPREIEPQIFKDEAAGMRVVNPVNRKSSIPKL
jgi:hypothetical protein